MRITYQDLERYRSNTIETARQIGLDEVVLEKLQDTELVVVPGDSGRLFYGNANYEHNRVRVYEQNPSRYLPKTFQEVWNQTGMDHELIGHLYNRYNGGRSDELAGVKTQLRFAAHRAKKDPYWALGLTIIPIIPVIKRVTNLAKDHLHHSNNG
jgi:hypothetical protein